MTTTIEVPVVPAPAPPAGAVEPAPQRRMPPKPPKPPRRMPSSLMPLAPLGVGQIVSRGALILLIAFIVAFFVNLLLLSHVQHASAQIRLENAYRAQLAAGTAPVSEGDFEQVLLDSGVPVAMIAIPKIGVMEVVVEGTTSSDLMAGPGHRRDTVLPGQGGVSVIMGRAAAYGGPFQHIEQLAPGDRFEVLTGQGAEVFEVLGVRYAGDLAPPAPAAGEARIILESARGPLYLPTGVVRVDAVKVGAGLDSGARQTTTVTLPPAAASLATDTSTVWALVLALQLFVAAEIGAVWAYPRVGGQKTWIVFTPVFVLAGVLVADQVNRLLPNLM